MKLQIQSVTFYFSNLPAWFFRYPIKHTRFPLKNILKHFDGSLLKHILFTSTACCTPVTFLHLLSRLRVLSLSPLTSYSSSSMTDCLWTFTLASSEGSSWERTQTKCHESEFSGRESHIWRKWKQTNGQEMEMDGAISVRREIMTNEVMRFVLQLQTGEASSGCIPPPPLLCASFLQCINDDICRRGEVITLCGREPSSSLKTFSQSVKVSNL